MTAAQKLCEMAGLSMTEVCRRAEISERRFKQLARAGKAPDVAAARLCYVLGNAVDPMIFIFGYARWQDLRKSGDAFPPVGHAKHATRRRQRPVPDILTLMK